MTLEELMKNLGIDGEENKEKASILKKEYNATQKAIHKLEEDNTKLTETINNSKGVSDKLNIVVKAFGLDLNAKDFDENIEGAKDKLIKEAGGGSTPEEIKELKRSLTKANRSIDDGNKTIQELTSQLNEEKTMRINGVKRNTLRKELVKNNVIKSDMFVDTFFNKVKVDEDGKTCTITGDDGTELSVADYVADWSADNPEFVSQPQKGGMGSGNGSNGGSDEPGAVSPFMQNLIKNKQSNVGAGSSQSLGDLFG